MEKRKEENREKQTEEKKYIYLEKKMLTLLIRTWLRELLSLEKLLRLEDERKEVESLKAY